MFSPSSRGRLTLHDLGRFQGKTIFDRLGRAVCEAGCLPRKELYEAWEVARRVRRRFRGGRVVDLAAGHGLLAHVMVILDDSSPVALAVDRVPVPSRSKLHHAIVDAWPRLAGRVEFRSTDLDEVTIEARDVVVSSHACGALTDRVLEMAVAARARVGVLPCCHNRMAGDTGDLAGWLDAATAIDVMRAVHVRNQGYRIWTQNIPSEITPKHRLLLAEPER